ncbi:MAG: methylmalonyl Co-A mutase-associated GTPase MeaB, partial [Mucilaginibacter sp.]
SGLMEIADAFIVNKADRADADLFVNNLKKIQLTENPLPVFKTVASKNIGIDEVINFIHSNAGKKNSRKDLLLAEKAYRILQQKRMAGIDKKKLQHDIAKALEGSNFNLYSFLERYS